MNKIFNGDCNDILNDELINNINLTVTSPPYNVKLDYNLYVDNKEYDEYLNWLKIIFKKIYDKTVDGGRCIINIGDQKNGKISLHTDIINLMNNIGWLNYTIIIWNKNHTNSRTAWGSFMSPSCPSFPRPFEYILVFSKKYYKLQHNGISDLTKNEFIEWSYGLWNIKPVHQQKDHPAKFPIEIVNRCLKMFSYVGDIVIDPFMGSATTICSCVINKRKYIGIEIDETYFKLANKNINDCINKNTFY